MTKIYGHSDDLIEIEGDVSGEIGCYGTDDRERGVTLPAFNMNEFKPLDQVELKEGETYWVISNLGGDLEYLLIFKRKYVDKDGTECIEFRDDINHEDSKHIFYTQKIKFLAHIPRPKEPEFRPTKPGIYLYNGEPKIILSDSPCGPLQAYDMTGCNGHNLSYMCGKWSKAKVVEDV